MSRKGVESAPKVCVFYSSSQGPLPRSQQVPWQKDHPCLLELHLGGPKWDPLTENALQLHGFAKPRASSLQRDLFPRKASADDVFFDTGDRRLKS